MIFSDGELTKLKTNSFVLHGLEISLTRRGTPSDVYRGAGFVRQTADGSLEYTIYDENRPNGYGSFLGIPEGSLLPEEHFYDLELKDIAGRTWRGNQTLPSPDFVFGRAGAVCTGTLFELTCIQPAEAKNNLWLFFPGEIDIPTNQGVRTVETVLERETFRFSPTIWKIDDADYEIVITKTEHGMEVQVESVNASLQSYFGMRLEEALWFTLAKSVRSQLSEKRTNGESTFRIRNVRPFNGGPGIWPPLRLQHGSEANHLGRLLILYLKYVLQYSEDRYHPISATILRNLSASDNSINSLALSVSIAIESLVERECKKLGSPGDAVLFTLDSLASHIDLWSGNTDLKKRIKNTLATWKGTNTGKVLKSLCGQGVIEAEHLTAWNRVRHTMAHGQELNVPSRVLIQLSASNYTCWLRIMFHVLGYTGPYSSHTPNGLSQINFPNEAAS